MANAYDNIAMQPDTDHEYHSQNKPPPYTEAQNLPPMTGATAPYPSAPAPSNYSGMPPAAASPGMPMPQPYYPPQAAYPPAGGLGYYPQQPYPMPATNVGQAPPPPPSQQQQQQVVVVNAAQPALVVQRQPADSYCCHIVFSCIVTWFCNILFGVIAFILAIVAQGKAPSDRKGARQLGHASIGVSIAGVVVTIIIIVAAVVAVSAIASSSCKYRKSGVCYQHKTHTTDCLKCYRDYERSYCDSYNEYCFYNTATTSSSTTCNYRKNGKCYRSRVYTSTYSNCSAKNFYGFYYDFGTNYCYHN